MTEQDNKLQNELLVTDRNLIRWMNIIGLSKRETLEFLDEAEIECSHGDAQAIYILYGRIPTVMEQRLLNVFGLEAVLSFMKMENFKSTHSK